MAMDPTSVSMPGSLLRIERLPQPVPSHVCLRCEVCCRFPEVDSFPRPYFTGEEISQAIAGGVDADAFPDLDGSRSGCAQSDGRGIPLSGVRSDHLQMSNLRNAPFRLSDLSAGCDVVGISTDQVVLGWDTKCPFMLDRGGAGLVEADHPDSSRRMPNAWRTYWRKNRCCPRIATIRALSGAIKMTWWWPNIAAFDRHTRLAPPAPAVVPSAGAGEVRRLTPNDYARFQEASA